MTKNNVKSSVVILICMMLVLGLFGFSACNNNSSYSTKYVVVGEATLKPDSEVSFETALNSTVERLTKVLARATATIQQGNKIRVEVPDVENLETILNATETPAKIEFKLEQDREARITGKHIEIVYASYQKSDSSTEAEWGVSVEFTPQGKQLFYQLTREALEQSDPRIYIYSNGELISQPLVSKAINGNTFISGSYTQTSAEKFAWQIMAETFDVNIAWGDIQKENNE